MAVQTNITNYQICSELSKLLAVISGIKLRGVELLNSYREPYLDSPQNILSWGFVILTCLLYDCFKFRVQIYLVTLILVKVSSKKMFL